MLLFLDIGGGEILLILVVVFLIFGPSKLPEMSRKLGKTMNDLKRASNDIRREIQQGASEATRDIRDVTNSIDPGTDPYTEKKDETAKDHPDETPAAGEPGKS